MAQRVPYFDLTPDEQNAIHAWLDSHGIDYHDVPADTPFAYNHQTGEWSIDRMLRNAEGRFYPLDGSHTIARETVTFAAPYDLPWRTVSNAQEGER